MSETRDIRPQPPRPAQRQVKVAPLVPDLTLDKQPKSMVGQAVDWLDRRTGIQVILERLLRDPVPERAGWWYTMGAAILLLTVIQIVTGIFLMFYYVPSWEGARESVLYIQNVVFLGWFVRGIHYWNMVMLVFMVGLHMVRTFVSAAYKTPRELTWVLGVVLLILMAATAFTGGILRWDQTGYFDVQVGTTIASWTPFIGDFVAMLWRGGETVGPSTLTRTFTLHVWILPLVLLGLALAHIGLVVLQGQFGSWVNYEPEPLDAHPQDYDEIESHRKLEHEVLDRNSRKVNLPTRTTWFFPYHVFKEAVVTLVLFLIVFVATLLFPAPIEGTIDPTTRSYAPSSMWFMLFIDQLLLLFPGSWFTWFGATAVPGIITALLVLLPWLDRSKAIRPNERASSIAFMVVMIAAIFVLGLLAASRIFNYEFINVPPLNSGGGTH